MGTIELRLKKHDEFQLELKFTCPILEKEATSNYYADMFFFLPRNLAVNPQTYSAEKFYNALSEYIRFQTPSVKLSDLGKSDNHLLTNISNSL